MFIPRLIVTDLDGTALKNDKTISRATAAAISRCQSLGIPVAVATARYIAGVEEYARLLKPDYLILTDGTLVYQLEKGSGTLKLFYSNDMDVAVTNLLLGELKQYGYISHIAIPTPFGLFRYPGGCREKTIIPSDFNVTELVQLDLQSDAFQTTGNGNTAGYHFDIDKPFPYPANKVVAELTSEADAGHIAAHCGCRHFRYRGETRYTFYSTTAGKLDAVKQVAYSLNIALDQVLAFGDDINDIEMIQHCGMGVAMGNALPEVKAATNAVTLTNEEDGLAQFLYQNVLA